MGPEITIQEIEQRLAALEKVVATLTAKNNTGKHTDEPCGKFAHLGGIERRPARSFKTPEKPVDLSSAYGKTGKLVRKASDHPTAESAESVKQEDDARK